MQWGGLPTSHGVRVRSFEAPSPGVSGLCSAMWLGRAAILLHVAKACECGAGNITFSSTLPNLLIMGDSISANGTGYVVDVTDILGGLANTVHSGTVADNGRRLSDLGKKGPCGTSFGVLECVDTWLDGRKWDARLTASVVGTFLPSFLPSMVTRRCDT